jgi:hypothetical protein
MTMHAIDWTKDEAALGHRVEIDDAIEVAGAIAVSFPGDDTGWRLVADRSHFELEGIAESDIRTVDPATFLDNDGQCYAGDDAFNLFVEVSAARLAIG